MSVRLNTPRGQDFVDFAVARCLEPQERRRRLMPLLMKSGVSDLDSADTHANAAQTAEFVGAVQNVSAFGAMRDLRMSDFNVPVVTTTTPPTANFVAQSAAAPVSGAAQTKYTLGRKRVTAIVPVTKESARDPKAAATIRTDMVNGCADAITSAAFDPTNAGSSSTPAALVYGVSSSASTGDPSADVSELFADWRGDHRSGVIVTDRNTAVRMNLFRDTAGLVAFPDVALVGGSVLGLPLIVTQAVPNDSSGDSIALVDTRGIALALGDAEVHVSDAATIEQDSAPQGASDSPTAASATLISAFQEDILYIKVTIYCDWLLVRPGAASLLTGASY